MGVATSVGVATGASGSKELGWGFHRGGTATLMRDSCSGIMVPAQIARRIDKRFSQGLGFKGCGSRPQPPQPRPTIIFYLES